MTETYSLYNGAIKLDFDPIKHIYQVGNKIVPGVTGVVGIIDKPALKQWAVNMAISYLEHQWACGIAYDEIQKGKLLEEAKRAHRSFAKTAADIGTLAHNYIEGHIKFKLGINKEAPVMPTNTEAQNAIGAFMEWEKANEVIYLESEKKIYSKRYEYAGTLDIVAKVNGQMAIVDLKTSSGVYPEMWLQTAAYQFAYKEETGIPMASRWIIRIGKDGVLEAKESKEYESDFKGFLGALLLQNRINQFKTA